MNINNNSSKICSISSFKTQKNFLYNNLKPLAKDTVSFSGTAKSQEENTDNKTGWVVFKSGNENYSFNKSVEELHKLSSIQWPIDSTDARNYLYKGEFHVYMENGQPKIGISYDKNNNEVQQIYYRKNNSQIPLGYYDEVLEHIKNSTKLSKEAKEQINNAESRKNTVIGIKEKLGLDSAIKNNDVKSIFKTLGIGVKENNDGTYTISKYCQPAEGISYSDLGIDENELMKNVREIRRNADFRFSSIKELNKLEKIGGDADFSYSEINDLNKLQTIGGNAIFKDSYVTSLGNLTTIGGNANFIDAQVKSLQDVETIGGNASFSYSKLNDMGNLETIGGNADFADVTIATLGNLTTIDGDANFMNAKIGDLGNLSEIHGDANFGGAVIDDFSNLKSIDGNANLYNLKTDSLCNLQVIKGKADICNTTVSDLGKLHTVGGDLTISNTNIKSLKNLQTIGRNAHISDNIDDIGKLKTVKNSVFCNEKLKQLLEGKVDIGDKIIVL